MMRIITMIDWFHPSIVFIAGSILIPFLHGKVRDAYLMMIPILGVATIFNMSPGTYWTYNFLGGSLTFGAVDKLSIVFGWVFTIASFISIVYALHVKESGQHIAAFIYVGGSLGVTFAGDFFTLFIFWELMAFSSAYLIFARREKEAIKAGYRYILVHIFGGVCLLGGIMLHYMKTKSTAVGPLVQDGSLSFYLILI